MTVQTLIDMLQNMIDTYGDFPLVIEAGEKTYTAAAVGVSGDNQVKETVIICE